MISEFEKRLGEYLAMSDCRENRVVEAMRYSLLNGGKRIRAKMVFLFCEACGGKDTDALPLACAVEMIHAYSLIHDDLPCMDDDDFRRGKPSCHIEYDYATALLAGDALQSLAFNVISEAKLTPEKAVKAVRILSDCIGCHGMVGGQIIDMEYEDRPCDISVLNDIEEKKTGALIKAACLLGCVAADGGKQAEEAAAEYASAIGRAFQIKDDLLDICSTYEELGKPIGSDADQKKSTFVSIIGEEQSKNKIRELTAAAVKAAEYFGTGGEKLKQLALELENRKK